MAMWAERIGNALAAQAAVSAVLVVVGLCIRGRPAAVRSAVWRVGLVAFLLSPVPALVWPSLQAVTVRVAVPSVARAPVPPLADVAPTEPDRTDLSEEASPATVPVAAPAVTGSPLLALAAVMAVGWALGLARLTANTLAARRLVAEASAVVLPELLAAAAHWSQRLGLRATPRVRVGGRVGAPVIVGAVRATLLLPCGFRASAEGASAVLVHELAHIRRGDPLERLACELACCLLWWHPMSWVISAALRRAAEEACDDWAMALTGERDAYAAALVACAERLASAVGIPAARRGGGLARRVREVLGKGEVAMTCLSGRARWGLCIAGLCVLVGVGITRVGAADAGTVAQAPALGDDRDQLASGNPILIAQAMVAAGRSEGEISAAISPYLTSPDARMRLHALNALLMLDPASVGTDRDRLLELVGADSPPMIRRAAARMLGRATADGDLAALIPALARVGAPPDARYAIAMVLINTGRSDQAGAFLADESLPPDNEAAAAYTRVLRLLDERTEKQVRVAASALTCESREARRDAAAILGGAPVAAREHLARLVGLATEGGEAASTRYWALRAIWRCGARDEATDCIRSLLGQEDGGARREALSACSVFADPSQELLALAADHLTDPDANVRYWAAVALRRHGLPGDARARIRERVFAETEPSDGLGFVDVLCMDGGQVETREWLLGEYRAREGDRRVRAAQALVQIAVSTVPPSNGPHLPVPPELFVDPSGEIRALAIGALPDVLDDEAAAAAARKLRGDPDPAVREAVAAVLDAVGAEDAPGGSLRARQTTTISNLRQLLTGALSFSQDYGETLPGGAWVSLLEPYLKNRQIYRSPGAPDRPVGFAMNRALAGAALDEIGAQSETVLFLEAEGVGEATLGGPEMLADWWPDGRVCIGFADGHAKFVKREEAADLRWSLE